MGCFYLVLPLWFRDAQIAADLAGQRFRNLGMPRHGGAALVAGIAPPGVPAAFANELTAVLDQVAEERLSL